MQIQEKLESLGLTPAQLSSVTALFSEVTAEHDRTIKNLKLDHGMQIAFKDSKAKDGKLIKALVDMDKLSLDEESGSIKGLDEQIKSIKESHAYLFESGEPIHNPIAPTGSIVLHDTGKCKEWDSSDMIL
jgi:phage minor structural protein GP20|nr:MAG TPA: minor structural protein [Caudoviricetes sp.]